MIYRFEKAKATLIRWGLIFGIVACILIISNIYAWANVILPFYSTGFGFYTLFFSLPLIVGLEVLLISYLRRKSMKQLKVPIWSACLRANITSAMFGFFFGILLGGVFASIWREITDSSNMNIYMRQIFAASYIITIIVEAMVYQILWFEKKWYIPEKISGFGVLLRIVSLTV